MVRGQANGHAFKDTNAIWVSDGHLAEVNKHGESLSQLRLTRCFEKLGYTAITTQVLV